MKEVSKLYLLGLCLAFGLLMWLAWPPFQTTFLIFAGFVPLLWIEELCSRSGRRLLPWAYLAFLFWNVFTTWWVWNSSAGGALLAFLANSILMFVPLYFYSWTKKIFGPTKGYISLIAYWLAFEYIHHAWELTWPWLTLGNVLSAQPTWIQWYEFTGTPGGSLWILGINILLFEASKRYSSSTTYKYQLIMAAALFLIPFGLSQYRYHNYQAKGLKIQIVIVQPNIDPYADKFGGMTPNEQLDRLMVLSKEQLDPDTRYLVWPETSLGHRIWINEINEDGTMDRLRDFLKEYPNMNLITGFMPFEAYDSAIASATARTYPDGECCYDAYNSALQIKYDREEVSVYHKSKLVIGVERIPYPALFKIFEPLAINLGGTMGSLGTQPDRGVFKDGDMGVAPVICYESIFGEYMTGYIRNGANMIFIITNDGWWGETPGYKQHVQYALMRCIETRRSMARSANTGTSCFINQRGDISQRTEYWVSDVIKGSILANDEMTFYTRHGDFLSRIATLLAVAYILIGIVRQRTRKLIQ